MTPFLIHPFHLQNFKALYAFFFVFFLFKLIGKNNEWILSRKLPSLFLPWFCGLWLSLDSLYRKKLSNNWYPSEYNPRIVMALYFNTIIAIMKISMKLFFQRLSNCCGYCKASILVRSLRLKLSNYLTTINTNFCIKYLNFDLNN